ncbi:MAG: porin family protein [Spirosomataceae bacterium]
MKQFSLIIFLCCCVLSNLQAQDSFVSVGLRAGANLSTITTSEVQVQASGSNDVIRNNLKNLTGFVGGVYVRIGGKFYVQPELLVGAKGGTFEVVKAGGTPTSVDVTYTNLDVPFLLGYKFFKVLRINAGPIASFNLSQNQGVADAIKVYTSQSIDKTIKDAIIGFQAGAGLTLGSLSLDVRYEGNFNEITKISFSNAATQKQFDQKLSLWQLTIGYRLF